MAGGQLAKLQFDLTTFDENVAKMQAEDRKELDKILVGGAIAFANAAAKHTPPDPGKSKISPLYYADGVLYDRSSNARARGRRRVYDLLKLARDPSTGHYRSHYGRLLRLGYYYVVSIKRPGKKLVQIPCRTEAEALRYAHVSYRGLMRAAWGVGLQTMTGKSAGSAFRKLISERPKIGSRTNAGTAKKSGDSIVITNARAEMSDKYMRDLQTNAQIAAVRGMNKRMLKYFQKKRDL